jgi:DNA-binding MarR family transcriptional regulator
MDQGYFDILLMFFKTFTNQERLVLLGLLADGEHSMDELSSRLGIKGPDITHHVAKLVELGLVDWRIDDGKHFFSLNASRLEEMNKQVMRSIKIDLRASLPDGATYQVWERKILDNYIDGERVNTLPSGYKKRLVVLKWIADHFEPDREYTEEEVNEIISRYYEDYCMVRREMYEERMMDREEGIYWRLKWEMPDFIG